MNDQPIITHLSDTDIYKYLMEAMDFHRHPEVPVKFALFNRHKHVRLADCIDIGRLREELDHCMSLRHTPQEVHFLMGTYEYNQPMFRYDIKDFLVDFRLPEYYLEARDGQFILEFAGNAPYASHWETFGMQIPAQLYGEYLMRDLTYGQRQQLFKEGRRRHMEKIAFLKNHPNIVFSEFGTRRRFSKFWQDYIIGSLNEHFPRPSACVDNPNFRGTSNVWFAKEHGLTPMGTNAHQEPMMYSGIYREEDEKARFLTSQIYFLKDWWEEYGPPLSMFLPDTFSTDYFLSIVPDEILRQWKGSRQDSGLPKNYSDKWVAKYRSLDVDPLTKLMLAADGMNPWKMNEVEEYNREKIQSSFGWGTNATNDLGLSPGENFEPLSLVVKMVEANGNPVCKLSDNIAKATGDQEEIERMKRFVEYGVKFAETCRY